MKRGFAIIVTALMIISLSGCASLPDLSEEQNEIVTEYAASLMLKYDSENHSRLVSVDNIINEHNAKVEANKIAEEKYRAELDKQQELARQEEERRKEENAKQEQHVSSGGGNGSNSDVVIIADEESDFDDITTIADYTGISGFTIDYNHFEVLDSYESSSDFVLPAKKGKKLLVLFFDVKNNSSSPILFDMFGQNVSYKCSVNGESYIDVSLNMISSNLAYASDKFSGNEERKYTLIGEIESDITPNSVNLKIEKAGKKAIVKILK